MKPSVHSMPKGAFIRAMRQIFTKTGRIAPRPQDAKVGCQKRETDSSLGDGRAERKRTLPASGLIGHSSCRPKRRCQIREMNPLERLKGETPMSKIEVKTVKFVSGSQVFEGLIAAFDAFCDNNPPFSWGDNNYALVAPEDIVKHLEGCLDCGEQTKAEIETAIGRLNQLPDDVYVDLEN